MNLLNCWSCKFFVADDPNEITGKCRRHAPRNIDYRSYRIRTATSFVINVEYLQGGVSSGGVLLPLYNMGSSMPTCHTTESTGLDANDIDPVIIPHGGFFIESATVVASRMNSGSGTVGQNPTVKVQQIYVRGADQEISVDGHFEVPINRAYVRPSGDTTDSFIQDAVLLNTPETKIPAGSNMSGFRLDLTGGTENDISEVRNFKMGLLLNTIQDYSVSSDISYSKYATINDAINLWCGEFVIADVIPALPEV